MTKPPPSSVLDEVLTRLWARSRFASYFYHFVDIVETPHIPTLALGVLSRRFSLFYNPGFVRETGIDHLIGLLVHEMLHVVLNHSHRMLPGRDVHLQNLAQDMVINSYLMEHRKTFFARKGFKESEPIELPPGLPVIPDAFFPKTGRVESRDVPWEKLYAWLAEQGGTTEGKDSENRPSSVPGNDTGTAFWRGEWGDAIQIPFPEGLVFTDGAGRTLPAGIHLFGDAETNDHADAGRKRILRFVKSKGECEGERLYADLSSLIREPAPSRVTWRSRILSIVEQASSSIRWDVSFSRLNRRFFGSGIYAPGRVYSPRRLVTVAVDVSGSMAACPERIEAAFSIVESLAEVYRVSLLCVDQQLFVPTKEDGAFRPSGSLRPYIYKTGDWKFVRSGARGATFFAPLFDPYMKGHREVLIILTDGYIYDLDALTPYRPTLWVVPSDRMAAFTPPFGRVLPMEPET